MKTELIAAKKIKQWGLYAFARYCDKLGISLDDCYYMVFGRYPTK